jgi:arginase
LAPITVIGTPTSAGAYAPGQEDGPAALRAAGLLDALGPEARDAGDVDGFRWRPDPERPRAANLGVVADRAGQVSERVAAALQDDGRVLVLGGDCTTGVGTVAGFTGRDAGLVYLDRHADLNVPASTIDGALDWMGVAHMLGVEGAEPELAGISGTPPMLAAERISFLGLAPVSPPEQALIDKLELPVVPLHRAAADPAGAARDALEALEGCAEIVVHFDVDVLDFLDAPLAENADRAPGLPLSGAATILEELFLDPRTRALTVTEFNPHHGDAATTARLVEALAGALVRPDGRG